MKRKDKGRDVIEITSRPLSFRFILVCYSWGWKSFSDCILRQDLSTWP